MNSEEKNYDEKIRELVAIRLETLPAGSAISIGSMGDFTKEQIIKSVHDGDEIGKKMIEIEMSFLQSLKDGILYGESHSNYQTRS